MADLKGFSEREGDILNNTSTALSALSAICLCCILVIYPYLLRRYPQYMDRTSLRLVMAIAAAGILYCVLSITSDLSGRENICEFSVWGFIATGLMCVFFSLSIAINLHIVFLLEYPAFPFLEKIYVVVSIALGLVLPTPALMFDEYGWTGLEASCWFKHEGDMDGLYWAWGTYYSWLALAVIYCVYVTVAVFWKLKNNQFRIRSILKHGRLVVEEREGENPMQESVMRVIASVAIYPAVPILTQGLNTVHGTYVTIAQERSFTLLLVTYIGSSLQGVLLLIVFLLDANIQYALECRRKEIIADFFDISKADGIIKAKRRGSWLIRLLFMRQRDIEDKKQSTDKKPEATEKTEKDLEKQKKWMGVSFAGPQQGETRDEYWGRMAVEFL